MRSEHSNSLRNEGMEGDALLTSCPHAGSLGGLDVASITSGDTRW